MSSLKKVSPDIGIDASLSQASQASQASEESEASEASEASARPPTETQVAAAISQAYPVFARRRSKCRAPYLAERAGWYFFIRRYPQNLREAGLIKQALCRISLRTRDLGTAQRLARALAHRFDDVIQRLEQRQVRDNV